MRGYFYNSEHYYDPTAGAACFKMDQEIAAKEAKRSKKPVNHKTHNTTKA